MTLIESLQLSISPPRLCLFSRLHSYPLQYAKLSLPPSALCALVLSIIQSLHIYLNDIQTIFFLFLSPWCCQTFLSIPPSHPLIKKKTTTFFPLVFTPSFSIPGCNCAMGALCHALSVPPVWQSHILQYRDECVIVWGFFFLWEYSVKSHEEMRKYSPLSTIYE